MVHFDPARARYNDAAAGFIFAELDLAITFCEVGLTTSSMRRAQRNQDNVQQALAAIEHILKRAALNPEQSKTFSGKIDKLLALSRQLENRLATP
jgi:hypothetical protein